VSKSKLIFFYKASSQDAQESDDHFIFFNEFIDIIMNCAMDFKSTEASNLDKVNTI
jgi:hypothetical protein